MSSYKLGDVNLNGTVDGDDFIFWNQFKFQATGLWSQADFNGNASTDGGDFIDWNQNKFTSSFRAPVPEPAAVWMAIIGLIGLFRGSRRRSFGLGMEPSSAGR
jgi:hypothetical protein